MIDRLAMPRSMEVGASVPEADTGDPFEAFFDAHRDRLFGSMVLLTSNRHEAEELTQDAFVAVWERWGRVRTMDEPVGYLYRTAMNMFRKRLRRRSVALRLIPARAEPADELSRVDSRHTVAAALASLPPRQRAAVVLTELFELPSEEAGKVLGVRPGTVRALAYQGRAARPAPMGGDDG
jgi:RNA polymerase sigma factor (sigma-70 family)